MVQFVDQLIERDFPRIRKNPLIGYLLAAVFFGLAVAGREFLANWIPDNARFFTFYAAVLLTALVSGAWPAVLSIAASAAYSWYFYLSDWGHHFKDNSAVLALCSFVILSFAIVAIVQTLNRKVETLLAERARSEGLLQDSALGEIHLEQLNVELRHRLKNTFAVMAGLVSQSARYSPDIASFAAALSGRLAAMGTAMDIVATRNFEGAPLAELVQDTMKPLVPPGRDRMRIKGPEAVVPGDVASALGLTLHELGTNAIKYGAWSNDRGVVNVSWTFDRIDEDESKLELKWRESGGPPVGEPTRKGLGTILIDSGFPMAQVHRAFAAGGVQCSIVAVIRQSTTRRLRAKATMNVS